MNRIGVMQVTDTLAAGGLERVAVNLSNHLPREQFISHLCVTRELGPLAELLSADVHRIHLARSGRWDVKALLRLVEYIRENEIQLLHAHGTSLFIGVMVACFKPHPIVVWHDHFGRSATEERPAWIYRLAGDVVGGVITVNQMLAEWARDRLHIPPDRIWCIPNFACAPMDNGVVPDLPGEAGVRIVCVANLRPEKDHPNLLAAMKHLIREFPAAHLILVGKGDDTIQRERVQRAINENKLESCVTWLGPRNDVPAILRGCDMGVLASVSEGSPLALIEYGLAGLPAIATNVGQCAEVLDQGRAGMLVLPKEPRLLADAMLSLLRSPERRAALAVRFHERVRREYGVDHVMQRIVRVYETVLDARSKATRI